MNNARLSLTGKESKPFRIKHGDVIKFGVDYRPQMTDAERKEPKKRKRLFFVVGGGWGVLF